MAQPPPNDHPVQQQITLRIPLDILPAWLAFDIAAHALNGLASQLQFIGKPELAGVMRGFAVGLEQQRGKILEDANRRVQLAGAGDLPKT